MVRENVTRSGGDGSVRARLRSGLPGAVTAVLAGALAAGVAALTVLLLFLHDAAALGSPAAPLGNFGVPGWVAGVWAFLFDQGFTVGSSGAAELAVVGIYAGVPAAAGALVPLLGLCAGLLLGAAGRAGDGPRAAVAAGSGVATGWFVATLLLARVATYDGVLALRPVLGPATPAFAFLLPGALAAAGWLGGTAVRTGTASRSLRGVADAVAAGVRDPPAPRELWRRRRGLAVRAPSRSDLRAALGDLRAFVAGTAVDRLALVAVAGAGAYLFYWRVGVPPLASFDEGIYANAARHALVDGYWLVPHLQWPHGDRVVFEPFLEKPPLAFWIEAVSMAVFGVNELGARAPNATYSLATGAVVYLFGRELVDRRAGVLSAAVYLTTVFVYAGWNAGRSGSTDPPLVLFGTVAVFAGWLAVDRPARRGRYLFVAAVAAAAATMVKGFGAGVYGLVVLPLLLRDRRLVASREALGAALVSLALVVPWPLVAWLRHGDRFVDQLWTEQVLSRALGSSFVSYPATFEFMRFPYFRWLPTFLDPWFFPALVVVPASLLWWLRRDPDGPMAGLDVPFLVWWALSVLLAFVLVGNHGWYLMPAYPAAALLLGGWLAGASRGATVPAVATGAGVLFAALFSPRFAGERPWPTLAVPPRIPGEGLRSVAIPDGPAATLALVAGGAAVLAAPRLRRLAAERGLGDRTVVAVALAAALVFVGATAAPVGLTDGSFTPAEKELGVAVDAAAPPDAPVYVTARARGSFHGGFAFAFYSQRPVRVVAPTELGAEGIEVALVTRSELQSVDRPYEELAAHGDRARDAYRFDAREYREVVVVRFTD